MADLAYASCREGMPRTPVGDCAAVELRLHYGPDHRIWQMIERWAFDSHDMMRGDLCEIVAGGSAACTDLPPTIVDGTNHAE